MGVCPPERKNDVGGHAISQAMKMAPTTCRGRNFLPSNSAVEFYGVGTTTVTGSENALSTVSESTAVTQ
jgi:hypothetical protein